MTKDHKGEGNPSGPEVDEVSGIQTTGHEWDGLRELDNPAPRWWLIVWMVSIVFAVGYWVIYPAWPTLGGHTKGLFGWTQFEKLKVEQGEIFARQREHRRKFHAASFEQVNQDPALFEFARAGGAVVFKENCVACHGAGGEGRKGYPNLNDDDWLFGGAVGDIYRTIQVGSRSTHVDTHAAMMPAFGAMLKPQEIDDLATYVGSMNASQPPSVAWTNGRVLFETNCVSCHGAMGEGNRALGAPQLNDAIWLYGGDHDTLVQSITKSRAGVMPAWEQRLSVDDQRMVAVYVHSLGGGE
ncbi:cytochrome c oxidase, cbb3-type, subunit III [Asticcacaulis biprosthecium C19]|uniref:Cbb3-type cytochrome c oxidase subunit n=1 Tax=Asticcacaulis biprosthecium C19 TaxID=715226 RepID=F4QTG4_9CAUL|nr:cytochrome-c oxidase, cbb3-type subunit III [Asticcacaulis biprosthecium]EGF90034.1 cytochrome c oxidase, cbb3-type, subunit III [Asticcacaulis biprosthecium C19]